MFKFAYKSPIRFIKICKNCHNIMKFILTITFINFYCTLDCLRPIPFFQLLLCMIIKHTNPHSFIFNSKQECSIIIQTSCNNALHIKTISIFHFVIVEIISSLLFPFFTSHQWLFITTG